MLTFNIKDNITECVFNGNIVAQYDRIADSITFKEFTCSFKILKMIIDNIKTIYPSVIYL